MARVSQKKVNETLMGLSDTQTGDLELFWYHRKWSAALLAIKLRVHHSTAYRRLNNLVDLGLLGRLQRPRPKAGGSEADLYYLTDLGAAVLSKYLRLGASRIFAPSVTCLDSNRHDLLILEVAIRMNNWDALRHRKRIVETIYEWVSLTDDEYADAYPEPTDDQFCLVPDLMLPEGMYGQDLYIEVEQTSRRSHIQEKYLRYEYLGRVYDVENHFLQLCTIFGDRQQEAALAPMHLEVLRNPRNVNLFSAGYTNMDAIREAGVDSVHALDEIIQPFEMYCHESVYA